jgi:hypothetical protein
MPWRQLKAFPVLCASSDFEQILETEKPVENFTNILLTSLSKLLSNQNFVDKASPKFHQIDILLTRPVKYFT